MSARDLAPPDVPRAFLGPRWNLGIRIALKECPMPLSYQSARSPALPTRFRCDVFPERDRVRVAPTGELDLATTPALESTIRELLESGFDDVVLDLADLEFLDSTGLRLILMLHAAAGDGGYRLRLRPGPPVVQRVFALTRTLELLHFETAGARPRMLPRAS